MNSIVVSLNQPIDCREEYEEMDDNVMQVTLSGSPENPIVDLLMSRNAMIGLGTHLLRQAYGNAETFVELHPSDTSLATTSLGVYLHPKSCRLNVGHFEFGALEDLLGEEIS